MNTKLKQFLITFCLTEGISHEAKINRTYGVLQYLVEDHKISAEEATEILDKVKNNESI